MILIFRVLNGLYRPIWIIMRKLPGVNYVNSKIETVRDNASHKLHNAKETALKSGILLLVFGVIIWLAVFMYVVFYYMYIPPLTHNRPVYLQFRTCDDATGSICSFPSAHVQLTKQQQLLMVGQSYKIFLQFEMPESEANKNLGMFMVCLEMSEKEGALVANSCRPVMLHYRSWLLHTIKTIVFSPLLVFGTAEEKQQVSVEMFTGFQEDQNRPVTDVYIEIQTKKIELYSSALKIHAHFTGLRYVMFHWPVVSAVVGIGVNLLLIVFIGVLSWYHLFYKGGSAYYLAQSIRDRLQAKQTEPGVSKNNKSGDLGMEESDSEGDFEVDTSGRL